MLLFLKERKHEFPQNISKLNEQESTFADHITENSPKEELLFYKQKNRSRTKKDCSLSMAEREVPVQMEDGLGECSRDEIHIQTATGSPVIAEGYQDNGRLSDHYNSGRSICMESYSIRFLTARQEQTEVVTRAGLVFSMRRGLFFIIIQEEQ